MNKDQISGNTYLQTIQYSDYTIQFFLESRSDVLTRPGFLAVSRQVERLKSIAIRRTSGNNIRAYKLTYETSAATGKARLAEVQLFGFTATVDGTGTVSGGTSLPAETFSYSNDAAASTFGSPALVTTAGPAPTGSGTWESVVWAYRTNTTVADSGSTLKAMPGPADWNKTAYGSRALSSGMGYVDLTFTSGGPRALYWGTFGLYLANGYANVVQLISNGSLVGPVSSRTRPPIHIRLMPAA